MTPAEVRNQKDRGLRIAERDVLWLVDLCESLAKAVTGLEGGDFGCPACHQEEGHSDRCPLPLAEAVLEGRWRVFPREEPPR